MITLYGIKSCDTVRKARRWLDQHDIDYQYHDLREDGLSEPSASAWLTALGQRELLNRRSTTWKTLPAELRDSMDDDRALTAVLEHPTLVKRPVLDTGSEIHVGFSPERYATLFKRHTL
ncbi:arsenate reductase [Chromatocurvus halotolerans]|uniref:Spx/MgsR family transcriptional regulator n=1 Tax=Chromatocurvus halotolerans TaxID=1132028 RepID=A0A4V2SBQ9_9GAMM|nr:arsenate reductase [Chromatocurvus halotolerans]TCO75930.1 Spx/MgsR family transcriptional regulator [Chromatocurvus halotolerans]